MLICNYSYVNQICGHNHSGVTNPLYWINPLTMRGYYGKAQYESIQDQIKRDGFPTGTNSPYSLIMGDKGALLSSTTTINGDSDFVSGLSMGRAISATLTGSGDITSANLSLITQLAATITCLGVISGASMVGSISLAASLAGSGTITSNLNLISNMVAALTGTGSATGNLKGTASLEAEIFVNQSTATTQELAAAVWNAFTADFNATGTMGEAMGAAGTAGDPWTTALPGAYGAGTAGNIIGNLLANIPDTVWDELKTTHTTGSTYGKIVQDLETLSKQIKALTAAQL